MATKKKNGPAEKRAAEKKQSSRRASREEPRGNSGFIFKPGTRKGPVFLAPTNEGPPTIRGRNGETFTAVRGDQAGGVFFGHEGYQWVFPNDVINLQGATLSYGGESGSIGQGNLSYRGSSLGDWDASDKGAVAAGSGGRSTGGPVATQRDKRLTEDDLEDRYPNLSDNGLVDLDDDGVATYNGKPLSIAELDILENNTDEDGNVDEDAFQNEVNLTSGSSGLPGDSSFTPISGDNPFGNAGFGFIDIAGIGQVPVPPLLNFDNLTFERLDPDPINRPKFNFTDPIEVLKALSSANLEQYGKVFDVASQKGESLYNQDFANLLRTTPQLAGMARTEAEKDNTFNQKARLKNFDTAFPDFRRTLDDSMLRAESYAKGQLPDTLEDRLFELTGRSAAADASASRGFGVSPASRKFSDNFSVDRRIGLHQMGEAELDTNRRLGASTLVDNPTPVTSGAQIPSVFPVLQSQNTGSVLSSLVPGSTLSPGVALDADINQEQFSSNNIFRTDTFNAQRVDAADLYNSQTGLQVELEKMYQRLANIQTLTNSLSAAFNLRTAETIAGGGEE